MTLENSATLQLYLLLSLLEFIWFKSQERSWVQSGPLITFFNRVALSTKHCWGPVPTSPYFPAVLIKLHSIILDIFFFNQAKLQPKAPWRQDIKKNACRLLITSKIIDVKPIICCTLCSLCMTLSHYKLNTNPIFISELSLSQYISYMQYAHTLNCIYFCHLIAA